MRKILVLQHIAYEILGTLNPLFKENGFRIRYVNFGRHPNIKLSLENYHGLIVLGGPMNVDETKKHPHLSHEIELIQEAIQKEIPVLGICLGAQLIAKALGATVTKNPTPEIGWYDVTLTDEGKKDPVLAHFTPTEKIFQWHGDTFSIPKRAVHLASTSACPHQAFRYRKTVYGFQFHLEVDEKMIARWFQTATNKKELAHLPTINPDHVVQKETPCHIEHAKKLSTQTFGEFIKLFGQEKKCHRLPSR